MDSIKKFIAGIFDVEENDICEYINNKEVFEHTEGQGIYNKCLTRFINNKINKIEGQNENLKVFTTKLTYQEEIFFDNILFSQICEDKPTYSIDICLDLEEISKKTNIKKEVLIKIIKGLICQKVEIGKFYNNRLKIVSICSLFTEGIICSDNTFCVLLLLQDFFEACIQVKNNK